MSSTTSRRTILAAAGALAAGSAANLAAVVITKAADVDPIFELIAAHHQAERILDHLCSGLDQAGKVEELDELHNAEEAARCELLNTEPKTIAGVIAVLRHVAENMEHGNDYEMEPESPVDEYPGLAPLKTMHWSYFANNTLADALEKISAGA